MRIILLTTSLEEDNTALVNWARLFSQDLFTVVIKSFSNLPLFARIKDMLLRLRINLRKPGPASRIFRFLIALNSPDVLSIRPQRFCPHSRHGTDGYLHAYNTTAPKSKRTCKPKP